MRESSVKRCFTGPRANRCFRPSACRFRPSSVSSGKNSHPWRRVIQACSPFAFAASSSMNETVSISMSGSLPTVVRVGVVARVLAHPPPVADADDAGREHAGEPVVRGAGGEDRAVRCLVREERDLREDDAEGAGDEQLEPAVAQQDEPGDGAAEREREDRADDAVEPRRAPQEARVADDVATPRCRCASCGGSRRSRRRWCGSGQRFRGELLWRR